MANTVPQPGATNCYNVPLKSVLRHVGDQVARKTTSVRTAASDIYSRQTRYLYKGNRKSVKLRVSDELHENLNRLKESGMTQQEQWDKACRWYLEY